MMGRFSFATVAAVAVVVAAVAVLSGTLVEAAPNALNQAPDGHNNGAQLDSSSFGVCKTCVFVMERIKKGTDMLLPSICNELFTKYPDTFGTCHQSLNSLSLNGNNVRYWLFEGCYKYEIYGAKEWVKPCPSHVMCSVLKDLTAQPFCTPLPMEDPFANERTTHLQADSQMVAKNHEIDGSSVHGNQNHGGVTKHLGRNARTAGGQ